MRLRDSVEIRDKATLALVKKVPAYVGYRSVLGADAAEGRPFRLVHELEAIINPEPLFNPTAHVLRWRELDYVPEGPAMVRRRGDRDHHMTIQLKRVTG